MLVPVVFLATVLATGRQRVGGRPAGPTRMRGWDMEESPCHPDTPVKFTVFLQQQGLDDLHEKFVVTSDPYHKEYGNFLTKEEVDSLVYASDEAHTRAAAWLTEHGIDDFEKTADSVVVSTTVGRASSLLNVPIHTYTHKDTGISKSLVNGEMSVPDHVKPHVHLVVGLSEMWEGFAKKHKKTANKHQEAVNPEDGVTLPAQPHLQATDIDLKVTPKLLREYYGIPEGTVAKSPSNYQAVLAFDDYYSQDALDQFFENTDGGMGSAPQLKTAGIDCLSDSKPCDQVESDLDVQYMTGIGMGVETLFHGSNTTDGWVLQKTENLLKTIPVPLVMSASYGWAELGQCDIAVMECFKLGYSSQEYVARTDANFQKLAVMGVSIMVSDGDDGAPGVEPNGWDPLDPDHWCPGDIYTCYPKGGLESKCGQVVLHNTTSGERCPFPVGTMTCTWLFLGDFYQDEDIENALKAANPDCGLQFFIDGSYNTHMWSDCSCDELAPLSHEDVVSEQMVKPYNTSASMFVADYPTSSPYVTSVGATRFTSTNGRTVATEIVASVKAGAIITTGGGFSVLSRTQSWQQVDVNKWTASQTNPPAGTFSSQGRGYPDVSFNGHNYQVYYSESGGESCPCKVGGVDGTSASSPAFAGMISLINDALLLSNNSPVGFLNPLLYDAAKSPVAFNDITEGDNTCTRSYCMQYGYEAQEGWDPASGLGSPKYPEVLKHAMEAKERAKAARAADSASQSKVLRNSHAAHKRSE